MRLDPLLALALAACTRTPEPPHAPAPTASTHAPEPSAPPSSPPGLAPQPRTFPHSRPSSDAPATPWSADELRTALRAVTPHFADCPYDRDGCACRIYCQFLILPAADPTRGPTLLTWPGPPTAPALELHADGRVHACTAPAARDAQPCPR